MVLRSYSEAFSQSYSQLLTGGGKDSPLPPTSHHKIFFFFYNLKTITCIIELGKASRRNLSWDTRILLSQVSFLRC